MTRFVLRQSDRILSDFPGTQDRCDAVASIERLESRHLLSSGITPLGLSGVRDLAWGPTDGLLYMSTDAGLIQRYDPATGQMLAPIDPDPARNAPLRGLDVSPDGSRLFVASSHVGVMGYL